MENQELKESPGIMQKVKKPIIQVQIFMFLYMK